MLKMEYFILRLLLGVLRSNLYVGKYKRLTFSDLVDKRARFVTLPLCRVRARGQSNTGSKVTGTVHPYAFRFHRIAVL